MWILKLLLALLIYAPASTTLESNHLMLQINNIQDSKGKIWLAVYDSQDSFLDKTKAIMLRGIEVKNARQLQFKLEGLDLGIYAIAIFHDVNENGTMDQSFIGIPKEPYAFSKRPSSKWRVPVFEDVKFQFNYSGQLLQLNLENW